jgi:hypothetical protein
MKTFAAIVHSLTVDRRSALEVAVILIVGYSIGYDAATGKSGGLLFWLVILPFVMLGTGFVNGAALLVLRLAGRIRRRP